MKAVCYGLIAYIPFLSCILEFMDAGALEIQYFFNLFWKRINKQMKKPIRFTGHSQYGLKPCRPQGNQSVSLVLDPSVLSQVEKQVSVIRGQRFGE